MPVEAKDRELQGVEHELHPLREKEVTDLIGLKLQKQEKRWKRVCHIEWTSSWET